MLKETEKTIGFVVIIFISGGDSIGRRAGSLDPLLATPICLGQKQLETCLTLLCNDYFLVLDFTVHLNFNENIAKRVCIIPIDVVDKLFLTQITLEPNSKS